MIALAFDLVDGARARLAAQHLVDNIEKHDWHLSTGFIGTKDLMLALAKIGRDDVAYRLIFQDTFPSWGFSIKQGATSIWERWDGWTPQNGFQDPGMNSFAHYSFGAVYQWMVENIGGIRTDGPAYKHILIAPQMNLKLTSDTTSYDSIRGRIKTAWQRSADKLILDCTIPANTTATAAGVRPACAANSAGSVAAATDRSGPFHSRRIVRRSAPPRMSSRPIERSGSATAASSSRTRRPASCSTLDRSNRSGR